MKGMATKKSHSLWWNSHISPRNSKWLSENLQETDRLFNEMLKLIEEDGDSFAKKAQMYYQRRPELVSHVEGFYRLYRTLAERYDNITSDLAKNISTEFQYQGSMNGSEFGTEATSPSLPSSPEQSSEHKPNHLKPHLKTAAFEVYLGLGESFDRSRKGSDESSSESCSDCDNGKVLEAFEKSTKLEARIIELENELHEARDKLLKFSNGSKEHCKLLDYFSTASTLENQPVVANKIFVDLMKQIEELQAVLPDRVEEIENLKEAMGEVARRFENEILCRDNIIKEFKTWISTVLNKFVPVDSSPGTEFKIDKAEEQMSDQNSSLEIETLEEKTMGAQSSNLLLQQNYEEKDEDEQMSDQNSSLEIETLNETTIAAQSSNVLLQERSELEAEISSLIVSTSSYRSKLQLFEERVKQLEAEKSKLCTESKKRATELNQSLDEFKMKVDTLTLERDELNAQVVNLIEDIETWDDESRKIDEQLHVLHAEHAKLIQEVEEARKASAELTNRVNELEDVVESQKAIIVDCAEGKKEAIRQLCFSLEHYRIGYQELRQIVQMKFKCPNS